MDNLTVLDRMIRTYDLVKEAEECVARATALANQARREIDDMARMMGYRPPDGSPRGEHPYPPPVNHSTGPLPIVPPAI